MMNLQKMMKQAQAMQTKMAEAQARLEAEETEGSAGSGAVVVRMNGKHQALSVRIDPSLLAPSEKDMLEDLLVAAINDAGGRIATRAGAEMSQLTAGLPLPPGMKLPF